MPEKDSDILDIFEEELDGENPKVLVDKTRRSVQAVEIVDKSLILSSRQRLSQTKAFSTRLHVIEKTEVE
ncbi:MAG: hypothetical protein Q9M91_01680 [Candidatus Dojkabacteria bacterium]|nr:hypothetical protein [Candidatus Dojkabacteria bacterium]MDQ7020535.1 hypothetical protein [Candidatus Dojkabacteria bacterium]